MSVFEDFFFFKCNSTFLEKTILPWSGIDSVGTLENSTVVSWLLWWVHVFRLCLVTIIFVFVQSLNILWAYLLIFKKEQEGHLFCPKYVDKGHTQSYVPPPLPPRPTEMASSDNTHRGPVVGGTIWDTLSSLHVYPFICLALRLHNHVVWPSHQHLSNQWHCAAQPPGS